jgi:hypothetical protein
MTCNEAINGPDSERWKVEVENEYQRMVKSKVFKAVLKTYLPPGIKIIDSVWAMKKKSNGTYAVESRQEDSSKLKSNTTMV